ncbi:MAG TPA: tagatose-6-phosphate ketose isomerase [Acidobacteriaceae bacterium]|nr:tagatose-6-phosphate ketose isomerase [Acidobacteriaceae bacterium]
MSRLSSVLDLGEEEKLARGLLHTPREIAQQPDTWAATFLSIQQRRSDIEKFLESAGISPDSSQRPIVFLIGAGTSDYIGQCLMHLFRQKWRCEVLAVASTDLLTGFEDYIIPGQKYLWISFSRSGDSPEGVASLEKALHDHPDVHHLVVSCNADGQMVSEHRKDQRVFSLLLDDAVNDRGLAMTSSFSNMVICGHSLANLWSLQEYEPVLHNLIANGERFLDTASECAAELSQGPYTRACFVGTGSLKGVGKESALKLLEMTAGQIVTMSESALGLRHGPIAALNAETIFVCFISSESTRQQYEVDLLKEIGSKRVVRTRVAVAIEDESKFKGVAEHVLTPGMRAFVPDLYRPPLDVIFGQLLGLFFSMRCKLKPDAPSPNGVITRVVQNVSIY